MGCVSFPVGPVGRQLQAAIHPVRPRVLRPSGSLLNLSVDLAQIVDPLCDAGAWQGASKC